MPEHRIPPAGDQHGQGDPFDEWLSAGIVPLPPPPGTLERVQGRARRRRLSRAAGVAAGSAVLVIGLATLPRLALSQLHPAAQAGGTTAGVQPSAPGHASVPPPKLKSSGARPANAYPAVPVNFAPVSVTFVGTATGWIIGQAGRPGHCGPPDPRICTSIARTDDGGRSWRGVPAPVTGAPAGAGGVSQLRYLNTADGWAFGPQLWATHDGGQHWQQIPTHGLRVTTLETGGATAYAVWARCHGGGVSFAAGCTSFRLFSSPAGTDRWRPVPGAGGFTAGGAPSSAQLVLAGSVGYLLPPSGLLQTGTVIPPGRWRRATPGLLASAPCQPGVPGQPGALLAAQGATRLAILCPSASVAGPPAWPVYVSGDGGRTWQLAGQDELPGIPESLAGTTRGVLVAGSSQGIGISTDGGASWRAARVAAAPPGGFRYVGMTTRQQGVAVPADPGQHAVWFTYDGGLSWRPSPIP